MIPKCIACGSTNLIDDVKLIDSCSEPVNFRTFDNPGALLFKGTRKGVATAKICESCCHVMLFACREDLLELRQP